MDYYVTQGPNNDGKEQGQVGPPASEYDDPGSSDSKAYPTGGTYGITFNSTGGTHDANFKMRLGTVLPCLVV